MKKYIGLFMLILTLGCADLERYPLNSIGAPQFWATGDDAILGINGVYNVLADNHMYREFMRHTDAIADNAYSQYSFSYYLEISEGRGFDASSVWPRNIWKKSYEGIVRANEVILNVPAITMDETLKARVIGEAKFLRALFYFHLTNLYGNVPLVISEQTIEESLVPRDPKSAVLDLIKSDLESAASSLPEAYGSSEMGRATKGAALALKARVHLYNKEYAEAIAAANQVTSLGYDLLATENFASMFLPSQENNSTESIFEVQFLGNTGTNGVGSSFNSSSGAIPAFGAGSYHPIQEFVDFFEEGDIRKDATVLQDGQEFAGIAFSGVRTPTGYAAIKGVIPDEMVTGDGDANFVVLRYAEIILTIAEAENELNGPTSIAYDAVNKIRNRATLENLPEGLSQEEMREAIKRERRVELAFEGHHYFDLLRYGAEDLKEAMESVKSVPSHERVFDEKLLMWPVPQAEININPNLLPQNPNW
ncbi:RagB/SusD family nutrient uptake outer membrane protein [Algoriphagus zhangzhouensis]|uniref:Starch-binding associating with outer membrane n=1 Tax=Algoriphagus zhangzhouensis TaxID=1073327 RepID=A0A1M7ZK73_9BACT|nr:RagB/SusD family nutrient uptake outer membrane protein [Algoriphagus zhangzhouensis]TDY43173.1 putative outer membrane starch-binding protein [Algoriphagus zhangzhouensis]SHO65315.1 Starch-binding associating with outer membrane [Algoriphagus zhangzhouensis]